MRRKIISSVMIIILLCLGTFVYAGAPSDIPKFISSEEALRATEAQFKALQKRCSRVSQSIVNFPNEENPYFLIEISCEEYYETSPNVYKSRKKFSQYLYVHPYTGAVYLDRDSLERSYWGSNIMEADPTQLAVELEEKIPVDFSHAENWHTAAWSLDGKWIACIHYGGIFHLIDTETGTVTEIFKVSQLVNRFAPKFLKMIIKDVLIYIKGEPGPLCFSPDNKKVAFSWANEIWEIDVENKKARFLYRFDSCINDSCINSLLYSCDGKKLIAILDENKIGVFDLKTKRAISYEREEAKRKLAQLSCNKRINTCGDKLKKKVVYVREGIMYVENIYPPHRSVRLFHFEKGWKPLLIFCEKGWKPLSIFWSPSGEKIKVLWIKEGRPYLFIFSVKFRKG